MRGEVYSFILDWLVKYVVTRMSSRRFKAGIEEKRFAVCGFKQKTNNDPRGLSNLTNRLFNAIELR